MESVAQNSNTSDYNSDLDYSQEFKEEMENSIINYFNDLTVEQKPIDKTKELIRDNTLIDNSSQDVEYIKRMSSLKGITDYIITDKIIPIDYSSDEESIKQNKNDDKDDIKMNTCNSDETLNEESADINSKKEETETEILNTSENPENKNNDNVKISESFANEFISLLDINMKELNKKKDDFHVIGLKKIEEEVKEDAKPTTETPEVKIKEEFIENSQKTNKRRKYNSILLTMGKKCSNGNFHLFRSKSTNFKSSTKKQENESTDFKSSPKKQENESIESDKLKKSKSRLSLSKIFKSFKKRKSLQSLN